MGGHGNEQVVDSPILLQVSVTYFFFATYTRTTTKILERGHFCNMSSMIDHMGHNSEGASRYFGVF